MFFDQGKKVKNSSIKGLLVQIKYIKKYQINSNTYFKIPY